MSQTLSRNFGTTSAFQFQGKHSRIKSMDRKAEEAPEGRKIVIILSDRSREIIRLFEELQRKRQQVGHGSPQTTLGDKPLTIAAIVFSIGFAAMGIAEFIRPMQPEKPAVTLAAQEPVRIVGPVFVPNVNPREH
jgi:hypothetical protein